MNLTMIYKNRIKIESCSGYNKVVFSKDLGFKQYGIYYSP